MGISRLTSLGVPRRLWAFYFIAHACALCLGLPSILSRISRDDASILGLYSPAYFAIVLVFIAAPLVLLAFAWYWWNSEKPARIALSILNSIWRNTFVAGSLTLLGIVVTGLIVFYAPGYFQSYSLRYEWMLLASLVSICILITGVIAVPYWPTETNRFAQLGIHGRIFALSVGAIAITAFLWRNNLSAQWGIVDDHEIVAVLGPDHKLTLAEMPALITQSEIWGAFSTPRYRPVYWLFHFFEMFVWGGAPFLWHSFRLGLFIISVVAFSRLLSHAFGILNAFLLTLAVLTYTFWANIWTALGPSEQYAVPALGLYAFAYFNLVRLYQTHVRPAPRKRFVHWLIYVLSAIICIGSKENFLFLVIPSSLFVIYLIYKRKLDGYGVVANAIVICFSVFVAAAVVAGVRKEGSDIYGNSIDLGTRLTSLLAYYDRLISSNKAIALILIVVLVLWVLITIYFVRLKEASQQSTYWHRTAQFAFTLAYLGMVYTSQVAFYGAQWPMNNRYDFPGRLVWVLLGAAITWYSVELTKIRLSDTLIPTVLKLTVSVFLVTIIYSRGYGPLQTASIQYAESTRQFSTAINEIVSVLREHSDSQLVIEAYKYYDFEAILSVAKYLRSNGVNNPLFIKMNATVIDPNDPQELRLKTMLTNFSELGFGTGEAALISPLSHFQPTDCYSITFLDEPGGELGCTMLRKVRSY